MPNKNCPKCGESSLLDARICWHCAYEFRPAERRQIIAAKDAPHAVAKRKEQARAFRLIGGTVWVALAIGLGLWVNDRLQGDLTKTQPQGLVSADPAESQPLVGAVARQWEGTFIANNSAKYLPNAVDILTVSGVKVVWTIQEPSRSSSCTTQIPSGSDASGFAVHSLVWTCDEGSPPSVNNALSWNAATDGWRLTDGVGSAMPEEFVFSRQGSRTTDAASSTESQSAEGEPREPADYDGLFNGFTTHNAFSLRILHRVIKFSMESVPSLQNELNCEGIVPDTWGTSYSMRIPLKCTNGPANLSPYFTYSADTDEWTLFQNNGTHITLSRTLRIPTM